MDSISSEFVSQDWCWNEDNFWQGRRNYHQQILAESTMRGGTSGSIKLSLEKRSELQGVVSKITGKHMGKSKWTLNVENIIINNFGVLRKSDTKKLDNNYM